MFWYGIWDWGPWLIVPVVMCVGMMAMMMLMGRGGMGWCGAGHMSEERTDPALETLRQRFASGELTQQEYEEQRSLLLRA